MKKLFAHTLAVFSSAALLAVSFPRFSFYPAAFAAFIPLLLVVRGAGVSGAFFKGALTGLLGYAGIFYWLYPMLFYNTGSSLQSALSLGLLCAYLSFYIGIWAAATAWMRPKVSSLVFFVGSACLWVSLEYVRSFLLTGFPWASLGYSQWNFLPAAQIAEWTGVFGVSFLCILASLVVSDIFARRTLSFIHTFLLSGLVAAGVFGVFRHKAWVLNDTATPSLRVAFLQGNIDQYKKWDAAWETEILSIFDGLLKQAAAGRPDLVIWPETSVPGYIPGDRRLMAWITAGVGESGTWNIISAPFEDAGGSYNASVLFDPLGSISGVHKKTHLVPFGEYVPFRHFLEPYFGVLNSLGDFRRGDASTVFHADTWSAGPSICSENFFGRVSRENAANGATIIVNQTNDAWFFRTAAPYQHFTMNVLRAIETRRPVAVCGNTGVTGTVAASGMIGSTAPVFTAGCYFADIHPHTGKTFYVRFGDAFAKICVLFALLALGAAFRRYFINL